MGAVARHILAFAVGIGMAHSSPAAAEDTPRAFYEGVWRGTIGALPVRACFADGGSGKFGAYFYMSRLVAIPLIKDDKEAQLFREGWPDDAKAPRWTLNRVARDAIGGTWTQGTKTLTLRLTRIPVASDDGMPCASMAFHQPRLSGLRTVRSRSVKDGVAYTKLKLDHRGHFSDISLESFQLDDRSPAARRINAILHAPFEKEAEDGWLACITNAFAGSPWGGEFGESFELRLITARWLSVTHSVGGFCGGAHPNFSTHSLLFDRASGAKVNPLDWFTSNAVKREDLGSEYGIYTTLKPALIAVILKGWKPEDPECFEATNTQESWDVGVTRGALVFSPSLPHVASACIEEYKIPFVRLQPWLNPAGRKIVATLPR